MLLASDVTERIIGAFFEVYRDLGYGFLESVYTNAVAVELGRSGMAVSREAPVEVVYCGVPVGHFRLDMVVENTVIVEVKASKALTDGDERQLLNYLRATDFEVGLLLHFGPTPRFRRLVYANRRKRPRRVQYPRFRV
jgi:GxxExxY protein